MSAQYIQPWNYFPDDGDDNRYVNFKFNINGEDYFYVPTEILEKGFRAGNNVYYYPFVLSNEFDEKIAPYAGTVDPKAVAENLNSPKFLEDLEKNNFADSPGLVVPASFWNENFGGAIPVPLDKPYTNRVKTRGITGIGQKDGQKVYIFDAYGRDDVVGWATPDRVHAEWGPSGLGKLLKPLAYIAPLALGLPPALGGALGLTGAAANIAGASLLAGGTALALGDDPVKAALLGGATAGLSSAAGSLLGSQSVDSFALADAAQLSSQGLSPQYISEILGQQYALDPTAALNIAKLGEDYAFSALDAQRLWETTRDVGAVQQNLITSGVDPMTAAELANRVSLGTSVQNLAMGAADAFGGAPVYTSSGLLDQGKGLDDFAKEIGGNISTTGGGLGLTDLLRTANAAQGLLGAGQNPLLPQQPVMGGGQPAGGVDYSGLLNLLQQRTSVPGVAPFIGPVVQPTTNSLLDMQMQPVQYQSLLGRTQQSLLG